MSKTIWLCQKGREPARCFEDQTDAFEYFDQSDLGSSKQNPDGTIDVFDNGICIGQMIPVSYQESSSKKA